LLPIIRSATNDTQRLAWSECSGAKLLGVRPIAESYGELRGELRGLLTGIRSSLDSEAQHKGDFKFAGERAEDNSEPIDLPASWRIGKTTTATAFGRALAVSKPARRLNSLHVGANRRRSPWWQATLARRSPTGLLPHPNGLRARPQARHTHERANVQTRPRLHTLYL